MRKIGGKLVILALLPVLLFTEPIYAGVKGVINSGKGLFVREKNNKNSEAIGSLRDKAEVEIVTATKNWYKIKYETIEGKKFGFVLRDYVQVSQSDKAALDKKMKKAEEKKKKKKKEEAKKSKKDEKTVKKEEKPTKTEKTEKTDKTDKTDKKQTKKEKKVKLNKNYQSVIVAADLLNVREKNSKKSRVIASVRADETYPIRDITENWVKIALTDSLEGYVMRDYVDFSVVETVPSKETVADASAVVTAKNKKDKKSKKVDKIKDNAPDEPFDNSSGEDPTIGATIDEVIQHEDEIVFTELSGKIAIANVPAVNVRQDTNTRSPILSMLLQGGRLEATGISDDWIRVEIDEDSGYIMKQYVNIEDGVIVNIQPDANQHIARDESQIEAPTGQDGEAVVKFAKQFLGNPYVWGGTSLTNGTDCSGFVQSVYRNFGYNLRRTSAQQRSEGIEVPSLSEALPGDLICYNGHIGIYMGAGKGIIHASNPRSGIIMTANPSYRPILSIRRILR